jgi:hypothetical protein
VSSRRYWLAAVAVITFTASPLSAICADFKGTGIHRDNERECLKSLPSFTKRLAALGVQMSKEPECEEVLGEPEAYAPVFVASSRKPLLAETAAAAPTESRAACNATLSELVAVVADQDEVIVESGCVTLTVADAETGETSGQFQPMVFLLKTKH